MVMLDSARRKVPVPRAVFSYEMLMMIIRSAQVPAGAATGQQIRVIGMPRCGRRSSQVADESTSGYGTMSGTGNFPVRAAAQPIRLLASAARTVREIRQDAATSKI
jgi:hypothetical protein